MLCCKRVTFTTTFIVFRRTADLKTWLTKVNYICSAIPSLAQYIPASFLTLLLRGEVVSVSSASTVDKLFASLGDFVVVEAIK